MGLVHKYSSSFAPRVRGDFDVSVLHRCPDFPIAPSGNLLEHASLFYCLLFLYRFTSLLFSRCVFHLPNHLPTHHHLPRCDSRGAQPRPVLDNMWSTPYMLPHFMALNDQTLSCLGMREVRLREIKEFGEGHSLNVMV
jgi:hypothetical protein